MDGAFPASTKIATGKASSAVRFKRETRLLERGANVAAGGGRTAMLSAGEVLMEGGIPILAYGASGKEIVGAVGVSGAKPDEDHVVAQAGVAALMQLQSKL